MKNSSYGHLNESLWELELDRGRKIRRFRFRGTMHDAANEVRSYDAAHVGWTTQSSEQLAQRFEVGSPDDVRAVEEIIDLVDDVTLPETEGFERVSSVCGGSLNVVSYLAGSPTPFRRRVRRKTLGPIRVIYDTRANASFDAKLLERRAHAALALVLKLQEVRPVELLLACGQRVAGGNQVCTLVPLSTVPTDLSEAASLMSGGDIFRGWLMPANCRVCRTQAGAGPSDYYETRDWETLYGAQPDDVVIPGIRPGDELAHHPREFIRREMDRQAEKWNDLA